MEFEASLLTPPSLTPQIAAFLIAAYIVTPAHIKGAACSKDISSGKLADVLESRRQYSAKPPSLVMPAILQNDACSVCKGSQP
jgi:hypothetical protein